jgi:biotin carboxyl carrier protein
MAEYQIKVKSTLSNQEKVFDIQEEIHQINVNGKGFVWDIVPTKPNTYHILHQHTSYNVEVLKADYQTKTFIIKIQGRAYEIEAKDHLDLLLQKMGIHNITPNQITDLKAPMPGLILDIFVKENQSIQKGDTLLILEAMKMENIIKAPADLKIKAIKAIKGQKIEKAQVLITFE